MTASYFTEEKEYHYGGNVGKNEAMLKFTSSVSVGLNMTYETEGNSHLGIMVCGNDLIERGITEIPQVMNRESLDFAFLIGGMDFSKGEELVSAYREAGVLRVRRTFFWKTRFRQETGMNLRWNWSGRRGRLLIGK